MSSAKILIVVDGIFNLTPTYPAAFTDASFGPDAWFTLSHLITTLRGGGFLVDTASRGFNLAGNFDNGVMINTLPDPNATLKGADPAHPVTFRFDDPSIDLGSYDQLWLFGFEGFDGGTFEVGPRAATEEPGQIDDSELAAITAFMAAGGGVFATGDHDGLGAALCGRIPRVRYMRRWYQEGDTSSGIPPLAVRNWPGGGNERVDTLQRGATDMSSAPLNFFFDDQSDDVPQALTAIVPDHPVVQGATGVLTAFPDHMHEGEAVVPTGAQLTQTFASDPTLSFAPVDFVEFPSIAGSQELPILLATVQAGTPGPTGLVGHQTTVAEGGPQPNCENKNFSADMSVSDVKTANALVAYDGHKVNVGRIVTDSSFHHYLDLNLIGDPCSVVAVKQQGFKASPAGRAVLKELDAFYVNLASWLSWRDRKLYFVFGKNYYGRDEVQDSLSYTDAFYLILEGYTPNVVGAALPSFSGSFNVFNIPGLVIGPPTVSYEIGDTGADANMTQRIRFGYGIAFSTASLSSGAFPAPSAAPNAFTLDASIDIQGGSLPGLPAEFFLLGGEDPYFANVNAAADNSFYLSQDLRVFTVTPTHDDQTPIGTVPFAFQGGNPTTFDPAAAYLYIQKLIAWLNQSIGYQNAAFTPPDTNAFDPLDSLLPAQNGALKGDSSVTPFTGPNPNYNFAIARVRLKGSAGPAAAAAHVKVFFRAFTTQTFDTDFVNSSAAVTGADPQITYPSTGSLDAPQSPLPGTLGGVINGCSLPFFATANFMDGPTDYAANGVNNQTIEIPSGDSAWAFFGCFLNVNDSANSYGGQPVQHWFAGSAHNCLVAQIAYADAPIENVGGVVANPEISDKLAQRNLQVTTSGNPGYPATHQVPQTIDVRPSPPPTSDDDSNLSSYPDEIMIDWGRTPRGSVAKLYWPGVAAESVLSLATRLYPNHSLSAADLHTIRCDIASAVTYIPIPPGSLRRNESFAGLTTRGRELYERSIELQRPWATALGQGLTASRVREVCTTMEALLMALSQAATAGTEPMAALQNANL